MRMSPGCGCVSVSKLFSNCFVSCPLSITLMPLSLAPRGALQMSEEAPLTWPFRSFLLLQYLFFDVF